MKRKILFCLIAVCFFSKTFSQNIADSINSSVVKGIIKINYIEAVAGEFRVSLEKAISHKLSWETGIGIIYAEYPGLITYGDISRQIADGDYYNLPDFSYDGVSLRGGVKFYTSKVKENSGFFWNPLLFYKYIYNKNTDLQNLTEINNIHTIGLQLLFGYKYLTKDNFYFEIYGGIGMRKVLIMTKYHENNMPDNKESNNYLLFTPQLGYTIGYKLFNK